MTHCKPLASWVLCPSKPTHAAPCMGISRSGQKWKAESVWGGNEAQWAPGRKAIFWSPAPERGTAALPIQEGLKAGSWLHFCRDGHLDPVHRDIHARSADIRCLSCSVKLLTPEDTLG
jgi:hypothetical protein